MRLIQLFMALLVFLFAGQALAADAVLGPTSGPHEGCTVWKICDAQTSSGVCVNSAAANNIIRAGSEYTWTAFADMSHASATSFTIDLYTKTPGQGYGTQRALLNSSSITQINYAFSWSGIMGDIHAQLTCTTCTSGVSLYVKGCQLR